MMIVKKGFGRIYSPAMSVRSLSPIDFSPAPRIGRLDEEMIPSSSEAEKAPTAQTYHYWSDGERRELLELVQTALRVNQTPDWAAIAARFGVSKEACRVQYYRIRAQPISFSREQIRHSWSDGERRELLELVETALRANQAPDWIAIGAYFGVSKQACMNQYDYTRIRFAPPPREQIRLRSITWAPLETKYLLETVPIQIREQGGANFYSLAALFRTNYEDCRDQYIRLTGIIPVEVRPSPINLTVENSDTPMTDVPEPAEPAAETPMIDVSEPVEYAAAAAISPASETRSDGGRYARWSQENTNRLIAMVNHRRSTNRRVGWTALGALFGRSAASCQQHYQRHQPKVEPTALSSVGLPTASFEIVGSI
jgi:hypothetical protein